MFRSDDNLIKKDSNATNLHPALITSPEAKLELDWIDSVSYRGIDKKCNWMNRFQREVSTFQSNVVTHYCTVIKVKYVSNASSVDWIELREIKRNEMQSGESEFAWIKTESINAIQFTQGTKRTTSWLSSGDIKECN